MINKIGNSKELYSSIEYELQLLIQSLKYSDTFEYFRMLEYHFGFPIYKNTRYLGGKRIRPTIVMLCSNPDYSSDNWKNSLPAAAAIELLHNFSLIHDDIQDNSETRRNRPTVWKKWGIPQAINAGDGLFSLANVSLGKLQENFPAKIVIQIMQAFNQTCLDLTKGQHMDIAFQDINLVDLEQYWTMIFYKTAKLLSTSAEIGAILAGVQSDDLNVFRDFGENLGLAFQVKDDILGIWGTEKSTGKSITSDLETSKKTLPVIYGLNKSPRFLKRWSKGNITADDARILSSQLEKDGAREYAESYATKFTNNALTKISELPLSSENKQALISLSNSLLRREA